MDVHFSSATDDWATPQDFFDMCVAKFGKFDIDVCASNDNAKAGTYYTKDVDGLKQEWRGLCWMNPPYGREIGRWMQKAYQSANDNGATVVCLVPARTDTAWWHDYAARGEVTFIRGRLKFGKAANSAPFPSALVVFAPKKQQEGKVTQLAADMESAIINMTTMFNSAPVREEKG